MAMQEIEERHVGITRMQCRSSTVRGGGSAPMARAGNAHPSIAVATRARANSDPVLGDVSGLSVARQIGEI